MRVIKEKAYWDAAAKSDNLRDDWICDKNITDEQCKEAIYPHLNDGRALDLGCGIGRLTIGYGVDISQKMINRAEPGNEYKRSDGRTIPYEDAFFENVFSMALFQHLPKYAVVNYIYEASRVLKPNGIFRFQYVEGDAIEGDFSYHYPYSKVFTWLSNAGFTVKSFDMGLVHKQWTWITAEKL